MSLKQLSRRFRRMDRQGVVLLVILGLLSLFMLVVVSFVLTANAQKTGVRNASRLDTQGNPPSALVNAALSQIVVGSNNPRSVIGPHGLLEDMYGEREGVSGCVWFVNPNTSYPVLGNSNMDLVSNGQFIEIVGLSFGLDRQPGNAAIEESGQSPSSLPGVPKYTSTSTVVFTPSSGTTPVDDVGEFNAQGSDDGLLALHVPYYIMADSRFKTPHKAYDANCPYPALNEGYYAGRVITMTSGPAAGQSSYIVRWYNATPLATNPGDWRMWVRPFPNGAKPNAGDKFVINGRPFNGQGFGFNPTQMMANLPTNGGMNGIVLDKLSDAAGGAPPLSLMLTPNPAHGLYRAYLKDRPATGGDTKVTPDGPDADEDYDIADLQNMALAGIIVDPNDNHWEVRFPSFHRPDLVKYFMAKYSPNGWFDPAFAPMRRRIMLRPDPADNFVDLNFDGKWDPTTEPDFAGNRYDSPSAGGGATNQAMFDPINGPFDVDNDNDGFKDSIWIDAGLPVQTNTDGRQVKPLVAFMVQDLDGRLNINAHGNKSHYRRGPAGWNSGNNGTIISPLPPQPTASNSVDEVYIAGGASFADSYLSRTVEPMSLAYDSSAGSTSPPGTVIPPTYLGAPFTGLAAVVTASVSPIAANFTAPTAATGIGTGLGFSVAEINLSTVLDDPETLRNYVGQSNNTKKTFGLSRRNPYRYLLEGNWDGLRRSTTAPNVDPNGIQRAPVPGRYGEPHLLTANNVPRHQPSSSPGVFLSGPGPGLTGSVRTGGVGNVLGDDNIPVAVEKRVNVSANTAQFLARGNAYSETSGVLGAGATATTYGRFGSPMDPNGRLVVGLDIRGMPIYANGPPTSDPTNTGAGTGGINALMANEAIDDPWEIDLSQQGARGTNMIEPGVFPSNSTYAAILDAPFTAGELEFVLRPRDADTMVSFNRLDYILYDATKWSFQDISRQITTDSWDVPMPNLQPTPEIRDGLLRLKIQPTNLSFADFLRGKLAAVNPTATLSQINSLVTMMLDVPNTSVYRSLTSTVPPTTLTGRMISPDLLLGLRMNLNRPMGNGADDSGAGTPGFGIVDEPSESFKLPATPQPGEYMWMGSALTSGVTGISFDATWDGRINANDVTKSSNVNGAMCEVYGRQEIAKHLYVLMMLVMDKDYIVPSRQFPLNTANLINTGTGALQETDEQLRKFRILTAYRVAQWAVNAVDFADRDACMTPFEFDIYPFSLDDPYVTGAAPGAPTWTVGGWDVDGNPYTDEENFKTTKKRFRGIVWGMEYPELLLTETLAFHDKGVADTDDDTLRTSATTPAKNQRFTKMKNSAGVDNDFDQVRLPQGSAFLELYATGREGAVSNSIGITTLTPLNPKLNFLPRELYDTTTAVTTSFTGTFGGATTQAIDTTVNQNGTIGTLDLGRLSPAGTGGQYPVWRIVISNSHLGYDGPGNKPTVREQLYDSSDVNVKTGRYAPETTTLQPESWDILDPTMTLPIDRAVWFAQTNAGGIAAQDPDAGNNLFQPPVSGGGVAPSFYLPPGGYAVIGPARPKIGTYQNVTHVGWTDVLATTSYSVANGPPASSGSAQWIPQTFNMSPQAGAGWINDMTFIPAAASVDPGLTYPYIGTDIKPPLLIPVSTPNTKDQKVPTYIGLNISEPANGYDTNGQKANNTTATINGLYTFPKPLDAPLDFNQGPIGKDNIYQPGTVFDYRTVFLQRLADPTLPYNPTTTAQAGIAAPNPALPPNPYITVDWMPIDLTIFNGVTSYVPPGSTTGSLQAIEALATISATTQPQPPIGWNANTFKDWQGWNQPWHNYLKYADNSQTRSGTCLLALETRQRGPRTTEDNLAPITAANHPNIGTTSTQLRNLDTWQRRAINGVWEPRSVTNNGNYFAATHPTPEAPLWSAISDNPRPRIMERPWNTSTQSCAFKHQVKNHTLGFINDGFGRTRIDTTSGGLASPYNPPRGNWANINSGGTSLLSAGTYSGKVDPATLPNYIGSPQRAFPWVTWNNRPYANAMELLLVPASSPARFTTEFSYITPTQWGERYTGLPSPSMGTFANAMQSNHYAWSSGPLWGTWVMPYCEVPRDVGGTTVSGYFMPHMPWTMPSAQEISQYSAQPEPTITPAPSPPLMTSMINVTPAGFDMVTNGRYPFGHLLNFFASNDTTKKYTAPGGACSNFHRIFEFVHVPSRFSGTEDLLVGPDGSAVTFSTISYGAANTSPLTPFVAPFNRVSRYREPGKVNINTMIDHLGSVDVAGTKRAPDVWHGLTNMFPEPCNRHVTNNVSGSFAVQATANSGDGGNSSIYVEGQYFRDIVSSRGRWNPSPNAPPVTPSTPAPSGSYLPQSPPVVTYDFKALMQNNSQMFNSQVPSFFNPFRSFAGSLVYPGDTTTIPTPMVTSDSSWLRRLRTTVHPSVVYMEPLLVANRGDLNYGTGTYSEQFSAGATDTSRNPFFRYQLLTKTGGMFTTRSNVYAIWVTVGLFEVERIPPGQLSGLVSADPLGYPNRDGFRITRELGVETGAARRYRGFAIIDRTIPVGFQRGETLNSDKCFLVKRFLN